jgi:Putative beta-lactamase-inhibitor-like, PepSY-like
MSKENILRWAAIVLISITITSSSHAQEKKIDKKDLPKAVIESFQKKYPKAEIKGASIEKEQNKTYYEIESVDGIQDRDLLFTKDGEVIEIEEALETNNIPDVVKGSVMKKYPDGKIYKAEKLIKKDKVSFEVVVEHSRKKSEVVLDSKGNIKKVEKKKK